MKFEGDFMGPGFFDRPEFACVATLLDSAISGVTFRHSSIELDSLSGLPPAEQTLRLLAILIELAHEPGDRLSGGVFDRRRPAWYNWSYHSKH